MGTPISNSMTELYTIMRYLQAETLEEAGITSFDSWASTFAEPVTSREISPEGNGKWQEKTRLRYQNIPELITMFKECADIKLRSSLNLDLPDCTVHNVNIPPTRVQRRMVEALGDRAEQIRRGKVDPSDDNMLCITSDGRKIGLDQRCMNPELPDDLKSKVNVCINNVFDIWQQSADVKGTQVIFCDTATPTEEKNEDKFFVMRMDKTGNYHVAYKSTLKNNTTVSKIIDRLNSDKAPAAFANALGRIYEGDVIVTKNINKEEAIATNSAYYIAAQDKKLVSNPITETDPMWKKLHITRTEEYVPEKRFCIYDDIKNKLVAKGIPEKEIVFIHDAKTSEQKKAVYDKLNESEIRVLIGSTQKCGAGMNAQKHMIALHDLDVPLRPSDVEHSKRNTEKRIEQAVIY